MVNICLGKCNSSSHEDYNYIHNLNQMKLVRTISTGLPVLGNSRQDMGYDTKSGLTPDPPVSLQLYHTLQPTAPCKYF